MAEPLFELVGFTGIGELVNEIVTLADGGVLFEKWFERLSIDVQFRNFNESFRMLLDVLIDSLSNRFLVHEAFRVDFDSFEKVLGLGSEMLLLQNLFLDPLFGNIFSAVLLDHFLVDLVQNFVNLHFLELVDRIWNKLLHVFSGYCVHLRLVNQSPILIGALPLN